MLRFFLIFFLSIFLIDFSYAQSSVNSGGIDLININGSVSASFGEVFYISKKSVYLISEGIQNGINNSRQSSKKIKAIIYPNPTTDNIYINIQNNNYTNFRYILYDIIGNKLMSGALSNLENFISLKYLAPSTFILKLYQGNIESTYKIIKIE